MKNNPESRTSAKTALIGGLLAACTLMTAVTLVVPKMASADSYGYYGDAGCGYGCGSPSYSYDCGCGSSGYSSYPDYSGSNYGNGGYNYVQYPYQMYTQYPQAPVQNGGYNYVQYPYQMYTYFQNPNPGGSAGSGSSYSYGGSYGSGYGSNPYSAYSQSVSQPYVNPVQNINIYGNNASGGNGGGFVRGS